VELPDIVTLVAAFMAVVVAGIVVRRHRRGPLKAASHLVALGAVVIALEHAQFAMVLADGSGGSLHARTHFFMAGVYTLIGLGTLCVVAYTLLRQGRRTGWFTLLGALSIGGITELVVGGIWFPHGSPVYGAVGFGWQFLYIYLLAWGSALVIAYPAVFGVGRSVGTPTRAGERNDA
jgi:hypothetical protein